MQNNYQGFLRAKSRGRFNVIPGRVAPESLLATECLIHQLSKVTDHANGRLLDIGCSTKPYKPMLEKRVSAYFGLDVPFTIHTKNFVDVFALGEHLPFRAGVFNTILCTEVLEHVPTPAKTLVEISRVLAPNGILIVTTPFCYRIHEAPWDYYRYTPFALKYLAEASGMELIEIYPRGGYLTVLADFVVKGFGLLFGAMRRVLLLHPESPTFGLIHRFVLTILQKCLWLILRNESLASDRFTLGYVFVLRKLASLPTTEA